MAIGTDDLIEKFGTQDQVDDGSTSTIANDAFSVAADISAWTNDDDAMFGKAVLEAQFDTTFPTVGSVDLFCRILNVQGANDPGVPDSNYPYHFLGSFAIDFGIAADTNFFMFLPLFVLPNFQTSQQYEFYLLNNGTGQTIGVDWNLWVTPVAPGPSA